jgi:hypothetical protein
MKVIGLKVGCMEEEHTGTYSHAISTESSHLITAKQSNMLS